MIPPPAIPLRQRRKLLSAFEEFAALHTRYKVSYGIPLPIREAYPNGRLPLSSGRSKTMLPLEQRRSRFDNIPDSNPSGQGSGIFSRPLSEYLPGGHSSGALNRSSSVSSQIDMTSPILPQRPGSAVIAQVAPTSASAPLTRTQSYNGLHSRPLLPPSPGTAVMSNYFSNLSLSGFAGEPVDTQANKGSDRQSIRSSASSMRNGVASGDEKEASSNCTSANTSDSEKKDVSREVWPYSIGYWFVCSAVD